jgi:hypothetical protein
MDYLIYNTEQDADAAQGIVFEFGKNIAGQLGYFTNGGIHGKKQGVSNASTGITTRWCNVEQRLDGNWIVLHPQYHPAAQDETLIAELMLELEVVTVETKQSDWFPIEEDI